ncbi:MAG: polymerase sigma-70 factor, subfamily [Paraburkholderia sp.]|nr:polymerase sigma-70 factor, subfamily [Paraburkholderia sp.]
MAETDRHSEQSGHGEHGAGALAEAERSRRFQQMALPHLDAAYNLARWLCGNSNDAEDIVQEAFMRALRFFDSFRGDTARPWLLAIVRRTWYTEWQRRASSREVAAFDDEIDRIDEMTIDGWGASPSDPQALLIREEDARQVHEALAQLPVEFREMLILRELEDMSYRDIAIIADLPIGTVMSRLARARRKLAAVLRPQQSAANPAGHPTGNSARKGEGPDMASRKRAPTPAPGPISRETPDGV